MTYREKNAQGDNFGINVHLPNMLLGWNPMGDDDAGFDVRKQEIERNGNSLFGF